MARGRRKNGEGCFSKNGNGYDYRISYIDNLGKSKYKYFWAKTKDECLTKANKWRNEQEGIYSDDVNAYWTVEQWANFWFDNFVVGHVKVTTISDDRSILDKHIIPGIGNIRLKDLTGLKLTRFYNECLKKSNGRGGTLDPKTVKNIRAVVNRMCECAYQNDIIKENPNNKAKYPKTTKKETEILSPEDYDKLIKYCCEQGTQWDMLIIFFLCVGSRLGETLGLQWSKINFEKYTIRIDQQMQAVPNKDKNSKYKYKKEIIDSTKTKSSNRIIPMFKEVEQILRHVRKLQAKNKLRLGQKYFRQLDLVFAKDDGDFICDTTFRAFVNKRLKEAGIEHYKIHSFRHSCATTLFEGKTDIKKVSKWLGHSGIGITLDTYTHVLPHQLEEFADLQSNRLKRIFNSKEKKFLMNLYRINSKNGGIKMKENKKKIAHKLTYNNCRSSLQFKAKNQVFYKCQ